MSKDYLSLQKLYNCLWVVVWSKRAFDNFEH